MVQDDEKRVAGKGVSRRQFLKLAGAAALTVGLTEALPGFFDLGNGLAAMPVSGGYLLVDTEKCAGCLSCMVACSLVHEGEASLSLSGIQVARNPLEDVPYDIYQNQCRQCVDAKCVAACPTGALAPDPQNGNVRRVDQAKCVGCEACVKACPFSLSRAVFDFQHDHAQKCDLCVNAPYWKSKGGPGGKQACIEVCPMKAIQFTTQVPAQAGDAGYWVNLRNTKWGPRRWTEQDY